MRRQGGDFCWPKIIIILAILGAGFFYIKNVQASQNILINEIMYDLKGTDDKHEWLEIYNSGSEAVDLTGWKFNDGDGATNHALNAPPKDGSRGSMIIPAGGFALLAGNAETLISDLPNYSGTIIDTVMSLSNTSAQLKLFNTVGVETAAASYDKSFGAAGNGKTLALDGAAFKESLTEGGTPGALNSVASAPPTAKCGNGQVETGESCDDGNLTNGDGCTSSCQTETTTMPPSDETASSTGETTPLNPPLSGGTNSSSAEGRKNNLGDVVINEFVSDPGDNEVEWIELYNKAGAEIDLSGWRIEDGGKGKTNLTGVLAASGAGRYKVIEKPAGVLNNDGDLIILYDATGKIIDQVAYGNWNDGNQTDNAPVAHDPDSVARKYDGYNSFNNANDFAVTLKPTKGASNIIEAEDEASAEAKAKFDFSGDIYLTEILPNPAGDDTKLEFIEIYNAGTRAVNLTGWSLSNEDEKKINLEKAATSTLIQAGEYLALYRPKTKIVLHNDQCAVKLFQPLADKPLMAVEYKNVKEGWSYNLMDNPPSSPFIKGAINSLYQGGKLSEDWEWSETITPGASNVVKQANHTPTVEFSFKTPTLVGAPIIFDSSDTADEDDDSLKYTWDFGDGFKNNLANPEHTFFQSGIYIVKLAVSDGQATSTKEKNLKVVSSFEEFGSGEEVAVSAETPHSPPLSRGINNPPSPLYQGGNIIINEVLPNPAGADTGQEWVEIKNQTAGEINLINWRLENSNGKYKFAKAQPLVAGAFFVLNNTQSELAFKNTDDVINLYNDLDELVDTVEYTEAVTGESYARGANGKWFWTTKLTPGQENTISLADSQSVVLAKASGVAIQSEDYIETGLDRIRELEIGSLIKVKGAVAVEPGILGTQIFYIVASSGEGAPSAAAESGADFYAAAIKDETASSTESAVSAAASAMTGIQIYNYKKDFPILKVGDYLEINGELAITQEELRIKTKDKNDINIVEHKPAPAAIALSCDAINEENIGQLITVTGEITAKKAYTAYLDDGNDEILVYFKQSAGLDIKDLKAGDQVAITGILSKTSTGLRLLPRYQTDIVKKEADSTDLAPQVLGESAPSEEWAIAERDKKLELFKYLLIIAGGVIIVLAGLFVKAKRKKV